MSDIISEVLNNQLKRCSKCKEWKDRSEFHKKKSEKDGLNCQCKACVAFYAKKRYTENAEQIKATKREWYKENREHALQIAKNHYVKHHDKMLERAAKYRKENPERFREIKRKSYIKNHDKELERARLSREANPTYFKEYREQNREILRDKSRQYAKNNPEILHRHTKRYRLALKSAEGNHTDNDVKEAYKRQKGLCYYCNKFVEWEDKHKDHKTPPSRGGTNWPDNIVVTCEYCNVSKGNKTEEEYREWLRQGKGATI